ncbi:MAG: hypothetical protein ACFB0G_18040 [Leptolyngbyaceae cyanobacterium]
MTITDLSALPVQVLVNNGTNDLDCSNIFGSLRISSNAWTQDGWWRPTAQLTLDANATASESLDPRLNPGRWAPGNLVSISVDFGSGWVPFPSRFKILKWPARPRGTVSLELGGDPTLLNNRALEGDAGGATYGTATNRKDLIDAVLSEAGCPPITSGDAFTAYPLPFSPEKKTGGSWIDYAGEIAWSANRVLWQGGNGDIRVADFTPTALAALSPLVHYVVGTNEADFVFAPPSDTPPETIRVVGTTLELTDNANGIVGPITEDVDGVEVITKMTYSGQGTNSPVEIEEIQKPRNVVLPTQSTSTSATVETETKTEETYSGVTGRLSQTVITVREPQGKVFPDRVFGSPFNLIDSVKTTITYTYNQDGVMIRRQTKVERAKYLNQVALVDAQFIDEKWTKRGDSYRPSRSVTNLDPDLSSAPKIGKTGAKNSNPPATKYRPPAKNKDEKEFTAEVTVASPTSGGYAAKLQVIKLPGGLCISEAQALEAARLWAMIRHGRQWPLNWAGDLVETWFTNFSPVQGIDFTYQGVRTRHLVDALSFYFDQRSSSVGGSAIELGTVALDGTGTPTPPYTISEVE